jgi:asparagine synthase (glutamine-hydrolysing)
MLRYVALAWNRSSTEHSSAARQLYRQLAFSKDRWMVALDLDGLLVLCGGAQRGIQGWAALDGKSGVVIGTLFRRGETPRARAPVIHALDRAESDRIIATEGRHLIEQYWGRYVAFLANSDANRGWIVRGPTASLPCYRTLLDEVQVYFSSLKDCHILRHARFSINYEYIAARLFGMEQSNRTGLNEISEVQPGECLALHAARPSAQSYWHALRVAESPLTEDPNEAATLLRSTVRSCVHAWSARYPFILHNLSGGLDSSIVLGCLKTAPTKPRVICINHYSPGPSSDEREYARLAARHAGFDLLEWRRNPHIDLKSLLNVPRTVKPGGLNRRIEHGRAEAELAREYRAAAVFGGTGGDQLFWQNSAWLAACDYMHRHAFGSRLFQVALDAARLDRTTVWSVLRRSLLYRVRPQLLNPLDISRRTKVFFTPDALETVKRSDPFVPNWYRRTAQVPFGKLWHTYSLGPCLNLCDALEEEDAPEYIAPLTSQPIVEVCLRLPTYLFISGGMDRGLARRAFAPDIPSQIAQRRTKGGIAEHSWEILVRNLDFVRDLLLNGKLLARGFLDRRKLEQSLSGQPCSTMKGLAEINRLINTEIWLSSWSDAGSQAAA